MPTQGQVKSINGQTLETGAFANVTATVIEGGDLDRWIEEKVATGAAKRIDRSVSRSRLAESY